MRSRTCPRKAHDVFACTELLNAPEARGSDELPVRQKWLREVGVASRMVLALCVDEAMITDH